MQNSPAQSQDAAGNVQEYTLSEHVIASYTITFKGFQKGEL